LTREPPFGEPHRRKPEIRTHPSPAIWIPDQACGSSGMTVDHRSHGSAATKKARTEFPSAPDFKRPPDQS